MTTSARYFQMVQRNIYANYRRILLSHDLSCLYMPTKVHRESTGMIVTHCVHMNIVYSPTLSSGDSWAMFLCIGEGSYPRNGMADSKDAGGSNFCRHVVLQTTPEEYPISCNIHHPAVLTPSGLTVLVGINLALELSQVGGQRRHAASFVLLQSRLPAP